MTLEDAQALAAEVADPDFLETYAELKARLRMYEEMHARLQAVLDSAAHG